MTPDKPSSSDLSETVTRLARIGACYSPSFSPDGKQIAFISNLNGTPQVWKARLDGGWPELVTALEDQIGAVDWSPAGHWLAFSLAPGGGMNQQVYLISEDGLETRRLTDGGRETNWIGFWTHDGRMLSLASNRRAPDAMDAYTVDMDTDTLRLVAQNQGIGYLTDISRDGCYAVALRVRNRSDSDLYWLDLVNGTEKLLTPHEGPGNFGDGQFSLDGRMIYLAADQDRENIAFARVTLDANNQPGPIQVIVGRDDAQLQGFRITHDGKTAALVWNVAGRCELAFCDLDTLQVIAGPALPFELIYDVSFSPDDRLLALTATGSVTPSNIWLLDWETGQLRQVTHSPHAGVNLESLVMPRLVKFKAHDGLDLSGWLYLPRDFSAPGPMVLSFHGGPEAQERPAFNATYQALLARGIAVFAPNVRGSGGFGKTFVNLDNGALRVNGVRDIEACAAYVISEGIAARERIGIMGGSYGGYMTMAGLSAYPDLFAAGANLFGVVNFKTFFAQTEPWMAAISKIEYGDPDTEGDMLDRLSPINQLEQVKAPTIVLHGANDTNVPVVEAEQVVEGLKRQGVPTEYILFPDEGHGFQKEPNRIAATVAIVEWFVKYLT